MISKCQPPFFPHLLSKSPCWCKGGKEGGNQIRCAKVFFSLRITNSWGKSYLGLILVMGKWLHSFLKFETHSTGNKPGGKSTRLTYLVHNEPSINTKLPFLTRVQHCLRILLGNMEKYKALSQALKSSVTKAHSAMSPTHELKSTQIPSHWAPAPSEVEVRGIRLSLLSPCPALPTLQV